MDTGKVLLSVVAGAAAGAALGVLFAPAKGSETRKKITQKKDEYSDAAKAKINEFLDSIAEKFEKVKEEVSQGKTKTE